MEYRELAKMLIRDYPSATMGMTLEEVHDAWVLHSNEVCANWLDISIPELGGDTWRGTHRAGEVERVMREYRIKKREGLLS